MCGTQRIGAAELHLDQQTTGEVELKKIGQIAENRTISIIAVATLLDQEWKDRPFGYYRQNKNHWSETDQEKSPKK